MTMQIYFTLEISNNIPTNSVHIDTYLHTYLILLYKICSYICILYITGSPLIGRKNGSTFLTNRLMRTVNKTAVL